MNTYEISSKEEKLHGVGMRAMLKKTASDNNFDLEAHNIANNKVRFEVNEGINIAPIIELLMMVRPNSTIKKIK